MEWMLDRQYTPPELVQNRVEREAKRRRRLAEEEQAKQARSMASGPSFQAVISQPPLQGLSLPPPPRLSGLLRGPAQQRRNEAPADTSVNEPARVSGKLPANPKRRRPIIHVDDASGEELPDPKTFITKRRPSPATPVRRPPSPPRSPSNQSTPPQPSPSDIRGREWTVARILNRREEPQQEGTAYLAEWSDSIIQERDIWTRADGTKVVRCDSADWPVYDAVPEPRHGPHARKVRWRQTWRAAHDLQGVEEMIQEYNNEHRQPTRGDHGDAGVDSGSPGDCLAVPDAEALPSREPSSPQVDDSREMNSSGDKLPVAPTIPGHRFHPKPGVDYRSAVHRFLAATAKAETKIFLQRLNAPAALPLLFAAWQCNLGGAVDIFRYSHATLVSISGFEQPQPCEGCVNGTGPFAKCVVGEGQFSHGSCTNCAYRGVSKKCCFHEQGRRPCLE